MKKKDEKWTERIKKFPIAVCLWAVFSLVSIPLLWTITPSGNATTLALCKIFSALFLGAFLCSRLSGRSRTLAVATEIALGAITALLCALYGWDGMTVKRLVFTWQSLFTLAVCIWIGCSVVEMKKHAVGGRVVLGLYLSGLSFIVVDFVGICAKWWGCLTLTRALFAFTFVDVVCYVALAVINSRKMAAAATQIEAELKEKSIAVMISQIQPHFLYNSLNSIAELCVVDPKRAEKATIDFARYLRGNMSALDEKHAIEFSDELKHLNHYIELEKLRYGKNLEFVYDIRSTDFTLPALTIQPLVENAVNHGIRYHKLKGKVTISSDEDGENHYVRIIDNGVGFDPDERIDDGRKHVGIANVKYRLEMMCGGRVEIDSEKGKGTVATVIIPKEKKG